MKAGNCFEIYSYCLISDAIVWTKESDQQMFFNSCPQPPKQESLSFWRVAVFMTQKKNFHIWKNVVSVPKNNMVFHTKQVWNSWNRLESAVCYYEKSFFRDHSLQQQVHFAATNTPKHSPVKNIPNTCLWLEVGAQTLSSLKKLSHIKDAIFKYN